MSNTGGGFDPPERHARQGAIAPAANDPRARQGGRFPNAWRAFLVGGAVGVAVYPLLPSDRLQAALYPLFGAAAVAAFGLGVSIHRPTRSRAWLLGALGVALFTCGDVITSAYTIRDGSFPFPSIADAFYLAGYPVFAAGILGLFPRRRPRFDIPTAIDTSILAVAAGLLSWVVLIRPYFHQPSASALETGVAIGYPLLDLVLIGVVVRMLFADVRRRPALLLVMAGLVLLLAGDTAYTLLSFDGAYRSGQLPDFAWLVAYLAWGAAALHPSMAALGEPLPVGPARNGTARLVALGLASLIPPCVIVLQSIWGEPVDTGIVAAVSAALFILVVARLAIVIDEARASEQRLRASEARLAVAEAQARMLLEEASDAILVSGKDGNGLEGNIAACTLLGYTHEELRHLSITDVVPPAENPTVSGGIALVREGKSILERRRFRRKDGSFVETEVSARGLPDGRLHAIVRDITARLAAEVERDRLAAAVEQSQDFVMMTDRDRRIVYANSAFTKISGFALSDVLGRQPKDFPETAGNGASEEEISESVARTGKWSGEIHSRRPDGTPYEVELVVSPWRDPSGAVVGAITVGRDVSRERALEGQLQQAQKLEAVGRLAGGIAHDFNNTLAAIRGYAELTLAASQGGDIADFAAEIIRASDRAHRVTQQLLTFARRQPTMSAVVDLNELVTSLRPMLQHALDEEVRLTIRRAAGPAPVEIDRPLLEQALLNLVINARDALPGKGTISISVAGAGVDASVRAAGAGLPPGRYASIVVADDGTGIDAEALPHLFEPFFTTKPPSKGTGLGLAIVYSVVTGSGGTVLVDSAPGRGARFELLLPLVANVQEERRDAQPAVSTDGGGETVLLVEDEASIRRIARIVLERAGYAFQAAATGEEALRLIGSGPAPAVLITDVLLPGINGRELATTIRASHPRIRVLFVSGYAADHLSPDGTFDSDTAFLPKPFTNADLLRAVRALLDGSAAAVA